MSRSAFLNSMPKAGTNLLIKCLLLMGYRERSHLSSGVLLDRQPRAALRRRLWRGAGQGYLLGIHCPVEVRASVVEGSLSALGPSEFISGHVGYSSRLVERIAHLGIEPILIVRDPRAVVASFLPYVLEQRKHFLHGPFTAMDDAGRYAAIIEGCDLGDVYVEPLRRTYQALEPWMDHPAVLTVRFEDLVGASGGGDAASQGRVLERIAEKLDVDPAVLPDVQAELFGPGRHTFRSGQVDSWVEEIPSDVQGAIAAELGEVMDRFDYA